MNGISGLSLIGSMILSASQIDKTVAPATAEKDVAVPAVAEDKHSVPAKTRLHDVEV
jgi:hypothetical protein